ncbi:MAG TPA: hypothetical protein VL401_01770 [Alphaproteobacteria bacterium]|jgi:antitoxin (DNA-binding transcriptional repressor) of toxin-antitoxin stability system|nr:hypothetical protein [Alphaproteobacteria bacterium]
MNIKRVSSTDLKLNTAEILNLVAYRGVEAIVEKHGQDFVKIVPIFSPNVKKDYKSIINKYNGSLPDFPEVHKNRVSSKKDLTW